MKSRENISFHQRNSFMLQIINDIHFFQRTKTLHRKRKVFETFMKKKNKKKKTGQTKYTKRNTKQSISVVSLTFCVGHVFHLSVICAHFSCIFQGIYSTFFLYFVWNVGLLANVHGIYFGLFWICFAAAAGAAAAHLLLLLMLLDFLMESWYIK